MTRPRVIKVSELIRERARIEREFRVIWGCDWYSEKCVELGSDESKGGDIYDEGLRVGASISLLDSLIESARPLPTKKELELRKLGKELANKMNFSKMTD